MNRSRVASLFCIAWLALGAACQREEAKSAPVSVEPAPVAPAPVAPAAPAAPQPAPVLEPVKPVEPMQQIAVAPAPAPTPAPDPGSEERPDVYSGTHKLGVNRVTDMARVGSVRFSQRDGALHLEGRVERGKHWLELSGKVEPDGSKKFDLVGVIRGVPDMAWNDEAPRERTTQGRFTFYVRKGRPYFRMYEVNGRECVCDDGCGNDFCYIDIEQAAQ